MQEKKIFLIKYFTWEVAYPVDDYLVKSEQYKYKINNTAVSPLKINLDKQFKIS